ncbi:hypothetical protein Igag_0716 [Ignisphaera aggregans DSM 17230]|uniref:Uncharacterized protein n=1 Tax=Ignisphaera aggregans (strain DSM 17230 / JCM 13409 / AQ1.S1) TaxID=583356 RepID=E0ST69_IGNAA|nr:hypothetical protein Igag_0716 [Ignisphaera aggregans DSM 17230]
MSKLITFNDLRDYFKQIWVLNKLTSKFLELYNTKIRSLHGKLITEVQDDAKVMVLGGLRSDGTFGENAYARFVYDFLGLRLEDVQRYVTLVRMGREPDVRVVLDEKPEHFNFIRFIHYLNKLSEFMLNKAHSTGILPSSEVVISSEDVIDVDELVTNIIEKAFELMIGINRVTTFVFSIRKITSEYLRATYGDVPNELLEFLGFSELLKMDNIGLWGFKDYFTKLVLIERSKWYSGNRYTYILRPVINGMPLYKQEQSSASGDTLEKMFLNVESIKPETLGGAICSLNTTIMMAFENLNNIRRWFPETVKAIDEYFNEARKSLEAVEWRLPEYLKFEAVTHILMYTGGGMDRKPSTVIPIISMYDIINGINAVDGYWALKYDETFIVQQVEHYVEHELIHFNESRTHGIYRSTSRIPRYFALSELLRDLMPAIFLGLVDIILQYAIIRESEHITRDILDKTKYDNALLIFARMRY